jgi:hypothetical protein
VSSGTAVSSRHERTKITEHSSNYTEGGGGVGEGHYLEKGICQCHFTHHKPHGD